MKPLLFAALCLFFIEGCNDSVTPPVTTAPSAKSEGANPDNTGVNVRDRDPGQKTAFDQKENKLDLTTTAEIRKRVVGSKMSVNAENVKIITENGRVVLRGPVKSAEEKRAIESIAYEVAGGSDKVESQLEIESSH